MGVRMGILTHHSARRCRKALIIKTSTDDYNSDAIIFMTPEEIKAKEEAETAKAKEDADAAAAAAANEDGDEDEEAEEEIDKEIDYEAELKKEREAREKAERALADKRFKAAEKKRKEEPEEVDEDEEEKPLTKKELQSLLQQERLETEKRLNEARAIEIAKTITSSDAERDLVLEIHKNRTFPAHLSLQEQIEEAYVIANRKKIVGENSELKRALKGKAGVVKNPAGTHRDAPASTEPKISPEDSAGIKAAGYSWNGTLRRWEKKLGNGDILVSDPKTKKTSIIKKTS
jgi:hypothetical protein